MERLTLLHAFVTGEIVTLSHRGVPARGTIAWIEREDGSGYCFNVHLYGRDEPIFVRCVKPLAA